MVTRDPEGPEEHPEEHPEDDTSPVDEVKLDPVRIVGARRAGDLLASGPEAQAPHEGGAEVAAPTQGEPPTHEIIGEHLGAALPHWTEPPTGQVPAVVSGSDGGDTTGSNPPAPEPTWREEGRDWDRVEAITPSLLAEHDAHAVSLNQDTLEERRPWEFDLPTREEPVLPAADAPTPASGAELSESVLFESWTTADPPGTPAGDEETAQLLLSSPEPSATSTVRDLSGPSRGSDPVRSPEPLDSPEAPRAPGASRLPGAQQPPRALDPSKTGQLAQPHTPQPGLSPHHAHEDAGEAGGTEPGGAEAGGTEAGGAEAAGAESGGAELGRAQGGLAEPDGAEPDGAAADRAEAQEDGAGPTEHAPVGIDEAGALAADLAARGGRRARRPPSLGTRQRRRRNGLRPAATRPGQAATAGTGTVPAKNGGRNIAAAIGSGVAVGVLVLIAFAYGSAPAMVVVTVALGLAAAETYGAFRRAGHRPATLLGLAAVVGLVIATYSETFQALPIVAALLVGAVLVWHLIGVDRGADPVRSASVTIFVFSWVGILGSFAALLLSPSLFPHRTGVAYLLGAIVAGVAYDVGALAAGRSFGRHPLASVSPGKTWEGLLGGTVAALALSIGVVRLIHPWTIAEVVVLGIVVSIVSPLGDLSESMVKRRLGLKDMGKLMPGHGGLLDRLDGLLFILPATYFLLHAFGHG